MPVSSWKSTEPKARRSTRGTCASARAFHTPRAVSRRGSTRASPTRRPATWATCSGCSAFGRTTPSMPGMPTGLPGLLETLWPVSRYKEIAATDHVLLLKVTMIASCSWLHYGLVFWQQAWNLGCLPALVDNDHALERDDDRAMLVVAGGMHRHDADIRARL